MLVPRHATLEVPVAYEARQAAIAREATGIGGAPVVIGYLDEEHATWAEVQRLLAPVWERYVAMPLLSAKDALDLPIDRIPQLSLVTERLEAMTRFRYAAVGGTVTGGEFFGALADRVFPSTQFIRWAGSPMYTPAPDVVHEIGGHAVSLANPQLAELHHLAGRASLAAPEQLAAIASVFWYSIEFGVVASLGGWKAYGTGLLSSPGELGWFAEHAQIVPLDIEAMISTPYDINHFQPLLFGADSLDQVVEVVGGYFLSLINSSC